MLPRRSLEYKARYLLWRYYDENCGGPDHFFLPFLRTWRLKLLLRQIEPANSCSNCSFWWSISHQALSCLNPISCLFEAIDLTGSSCNWIRNSNNGWESILLKCAVCVTTIRFCRRFLVDTFCGIENLAMPQREIPIDHSLRCPSSIHQSARIS